MRDFDTKPQPTKMTDLHALSFNCSRCGNCCRGLRVAVTHHDVMRLVSATHDSAASLVAFLPPDEVDMEGEPESFVELPAGRRLLVLAQTRGACALLEPNQGCRVYGARPRDCRLFPFDATFSREGALLRLELLPFAECEATRDGHNDPRWLHVEETLRQRELRDYRTRVTHWNRFACHRRRLGHRARTELEFLAFLGLAEAASAERPRLGDEGKAVSPNGGASRVES